MDFNDIVKEFAQKKALIYANDELLTSSKLMCENLFENCRTALAMNIFPDIQRLFAYEYNKFQDDGIIEESLAPEVKINEFAQIVLSETYCKEFDEKFEYRS